VAYRLTREEVYARRKERESSFTADPAVPFSGYLLSLYGDSGYSRGHHAPAADMAYSDETMADSFRASNISPQNLALNRAFWSDVELEVRHIATRAKAALVVTGPVLPAEGGARLGFLGPVIPEGFFKVVLPEGAPRASATAFLVPNADVSGPIKAYVATLDEVERATGLRLFPGASLP